MKIYTSVGGCVTLSSDTLQDNKRYAVVLQALNVVQMKNYPSTISEALMAIKDDWMAHTHRRFNLKPRLNLAY